MADAKSLFQVVIAAVDRLSAPFEKMQAKVTAFNAPIREIGERFEHLGEVAGIEKVAESFHRVRESVGGALEKLREFAGPLAALGAIGSIAGLGEIAVKTGELAEQLEKASKQIGIGVEDLQKLQYAAKASEVPIESLHKAMEMLNRRVGDAARGKNGQVADLFKKKMGGFTDAAGHALNAAQLLPRIADLFERNTNATTRAAMGNALFGRGYAEMLPLLVGGSAALKHWAEQAEHVGVLNEKQLAASAEMGLAFKNLRLTVEGISNAIGARLAPVLTPMIDRFTDWLQLHREIIATKIEHVVKQLADALEKVDWKGFAAGVEHTVEKITDFVKNTLGLHGTLIALAAVMGAPLLSAIGGIGVAFAGLATTLAANPVILAIGAVSLAGFELYENWGAIGKWWHGLWKGMADDATQAKTAMTPPAPVDRVEKHQSGRYANIKSAGETGGEEAYRWYESRAGRNTNANWRRGGPAAQLGDTMAGISAAINAKSAALIESMKGTNFSVLPMLQLQFAGVPNAVFPNPKPLGQRLRGDGADLKPLERISLRDDGKADLIQAVRDLTARLSRDTLGEIDVNFNGAPPGTRVLGKTAGPVKTNVNVGYNMVLPGQEH